MILGQSELNSQELAVVRVLIAADEVHETPFPAWEGIAVCVALTLAPQVCEDSPQTAARPVFGQPNPFQKVSLKCLEPCSQLRTKKDLSETPVLIED